MKKLIFFLCVSFPVAAQNRHTPLLGNTTSLAGGIIFSKNTCLNLEAGRTYGFGTYLTNPVDIIHSVTPGIGVEYNPFRNCPDLYKVFVDYDVAMFTYTHRTAKLKLDVLTPDARHYFIRPSAGLSRHVRIGKNLDLKVELLYGYLFKFHTDQPFPKHCAMLRLKYNFGYIRQFLRVIC